VFFTNNPAQYRQHNSHSQLIIFKNAGMPQRGYLAVAIGYQNIHLPQRGYPTSNKELNDARSLLSGFSFFISKKHFFIALLSAIFTFLNDYARSVSL
jgi:hypothetical protein